MHVSRKGVRGRKEGEGKETETSKWCGERRTKDTHKK